MNNLVEIQLIQHAEFAGGDVTTEEVLTAQTNLLKRLRAEFDDVVTISTKDDRTSQGSKGDPITLATMAVAALTGGSAVALINCIKSVLDRTPKLAVKII